MYIFTQTHTYTKSCLKGKGLQLIKNKFEGGTYYQGPFKNIYFFLAYLLS